MSLRSTIDSMIPPTTLQDIVGDMKTYLREQHSHPDVQYTEGEEIRSSAGKDLTNRILNDQHNHPDITEQGLSEETKQALRESLRNSE